MHLSKKQILITGVYRSGTEFFSNLLNLHPEICSTMYRINALRFIFFKYGKKKINYKKLIFDLSERLKNKHSFSIDKKKYLKIINGKNYGEIYDLIMSNLYLTKKKRIWAEKNQLVWTKTSDFINLLPNGYVIHILRDPRNVLASFKYKTNSNYPACLTSVFNSYDAMENILNNKKSNKQKFILIKYEDLVLNPQKTLNKVFDFLDIKKMNINTKRKKFNYLNKKWVVNSSFQSKIKNSSDFNIKESLNSYKKNLDIFELNFVEKICGNLMKKFGYKLNSSDNKKINKKQLLTLLDKNRLLKMGYENWKNKKKGFERFPKNPVNPKFWDKIQK